LTTTSTLDDDDTKANQLIAAIMVRLSRRKERLKYLKERVRTRAKARLMSLFDEDELEDGDDDDDDFKDELAFANLLMDLSTIQRLKRTRRSRYLTRLMYRRSSNNQFMDDLESGDDSFLNDDEFLQKYRMHRSSFIKLVNKIKDHTIFAKYVNVCCLLQF
jgi:hypothetical protein